MDSLQLLTLYLALTPIFSGRKANINLHTTPKLTVVIPISFLLPCADPGIFVRGQGVHVIVGLVYRSQMVNFIEKYHFSRFRRGSKFFQGRPTFFQGGGGGVHLLIPYRNPNNVIFQGGGSGPPAPLWIHTWL